MGGPAGSGGSDKSDEKKVDTYADQLKKIQKRKSPFKRDKDGNIKKKNILDKYVDNNPLLQGVKNLSDKVNLNKRMKFANEQGINIQGLSTEEILSKDFKSQLEAKGYSQGAGDNNNRDNDRNDNQPISEANISEQEMNEEEVTDTSEPSYGDEENLTAEEIKLRNKRKGRKNTVLTSVSGDTSDATLGKKTLLGG